MSNENEQQTQVDFQADDGWGAEFDRQVGDAAAAAKKGEPIVEDPLSDLTGGAPAAGSPQTTQPAAQSPAPAAQEAPAAVVASTPAADDAFLAGLTPEVRAVFESERSARQAAEQRARSDAGRVQALQRQTDELVRRAEEAKLPPDYLRSAFKDPQQWERFEQDYPDVAKTIEEGMNGAINGVRAEVERRLAPMQQQLQTSEIMRQKSSLREAHPDFETIQSGQDFWNWVNSSPIEVQELAQSDDAAEVSWLLSQYKAAAGVRERTPVADLSDARRQRVARSASQPVGGAAARVASRSTSDGTWEGDWDELDRAAVKR